MSKEIVIPLELKYDFAIKAYSSVHKGYLYAIRKKYGAATALEIYKELIKMGDRIKNFTNFLLNTFKIEGNDVEAIDRWWDIHHELTGVEGTALELSKKFSRSKVSKCPFKTEYKDLSDWCLIYQDLINTTINPKATSEAIKQMCAGDSYCEFVTKIEE